MTDPTTVHAWMVAQTRRRAAAPALARPPAWPASGPSTRLGLSHPQTHPAVASTIWRTLGDVFEAVRVRECAQLLERLVLDLADPLARDVERPPDLVERARMLAVEPVAKLEHAT